MLPTLKFFFITCLLLGLTACSGLPSQADQYGSFAKYAEAVFKHQNNLNSRLMLLNDSEVLVQHPDIEKAEQSMNEACHLLTLYAENEVEGKSMGLLFKRQVQSSIEECDRKINALDALLTALDE